MTHYQLCLHAHKLRKGFLGRRPSPYAVVTLDDADGTQLGRTEICEPCTSADWCLSMKIAFEPSEEFGFRVTVWDSSQRDDRKIAEARFDANEVYNSPGHMQMKEDERGTQ